jgi:hypothetical protein
MQCSGLRYRVTYGDVPGEHAVLHSEHYVGSGAHTCTGHCSCSAAALACYRLPRLVEPAA